MQHLTTFIPPESTYRPIPIPLPGISAGDKWRLGLFANEQSARTQRLRTTLASRADVDVVGVWSEPISITPGPGVGVGVGHDKRDSKKVKLDPKSSKGKSKEKELKEDVPKQTRIHREWVYDDSPDRIDKVLRIIEQTSYDLDKVRTLHDPSIHGMQLGRKANAGRRKYGIQA